MNNLYLSENQFQFAADLYKEMRQFWILQDILLNGKFSKESLYDDVEYLVHETQLRIDELIQRYVDNEIERL